MDAVNVVNIVNDPMILLEYVFDGTITTKDDGKRLFTEDANEGEAGSFITVKVKKIAGFEVPEIKYKKKVKTKVQTDHKLTGIGETPFEKRAGYEYPVIELPSRVANRILRAEELKKTHNFRVAVPLKEGDKVRKNDLVPEGYKRGKFGHLVKIETAE